MRIDEYYVDNVERSGIPKIEIPVRLQDLDIDTIKYYLPDCISQLKENAKKIKYLKNYVNGAYQQIKSDDLKQQSSKRANNRIIENHAHEIVQFKEGFRCGNKRQLVNREGIGNNDVAYLEKFLADVDFDSKLIEWVRNVYATGIGTTFIMPRADIFDETIVNGERRVKYKTADDGYDVNVNSPFVYETVNSEENAVVYSSCIGESGLKDLFCFNIANVLNKETKSTEEVVTVYTREAIYEYKKINYVYTLTKIADNTIYGELPMTEHSINAARISTVEFVYDLLNAINLFISLEANSFQDKVNQLLVFANCDLEQTSVDDLYEDGVVCLPPAMGGNLNPSVYTIQNEFNYTDINAIIERTQTRAFDIAGVALASSSVSSGNNEAAYLGGGWTNASIVMNREIVYGEKSERAELRKMIKSCKLNPDNPVQSIHANEINIKYNINQSNNIVAKTQGIQNLYDVGIAEEDIVKAIPFFGDEDGVAKRWKENNAQKAKEETAQSNTKLTGDNLRGAQKQQIKDQTIVNQAGSV